eukprot:scaffold803_cov310-Pinguiococcus_pyrenoidosus.AAC.120
MLRVSKIRQVQAPGNILLGAPGPQLEQSVDGVHAATLGVHAGLHGGDRRVVRTPVLHLGCTGRLFRRLAPLPATPAARTALLGLVLGRWRQFLPASPPAGGAATGPQRPLRPVAGLHGLLWLRRGGHSHRRLLRSLGRLGHREGDRLAESRRAPLGRCRIKRRAFGGVAHAEWAGFPCARERPRKLRGGARGSGANAEGGTQHRRPRRTRRHTLEGGGGGGPDKSRVQPGVKRVFPGSTLDGL